MFWKKDKIKELGIAVFLVAVGVVLRLLPHPANFAPISAIALFGGVYLSRKTAVVLPLLAMLVGDFFLGFYELRLGLAVYGSFLLIAGLGLLIKSRKSVLKVAGGALTGSILFFLTTNFAVWAFTPWYAKTSAGLLNCYLTALPFFGNTILGDLFYVTVFFGAYELSVLYFGNKNLKVKTITNH
ncbi:MAG: DUF6580 family putative transport protein [Patescibacteria group bacterium]